MKKMKKMKKMEKMLIEKDASIFLYLDKIKSEVNIGE